MAASRVGCVVAGGGVVGLAVARELSRRGRETLLLEAAQSIGSGTSARNSVSPYCTCLLGIHLVVSRLVVAPSLRRAQARATRVRPPVAHDRVENTGGKRRCRGLC